MTDTPKDLLPLIIEGIRDRKGSGIAVVDLSAIEGAAVSRFVICQGTSTQNVAAIADSVREYLLEHARVKPYDYEGYPTSRWIVIDYGDTMVHVFIPEDRERYDLEGLWADAVITRVPDLD